MFFSFCKIHSVLSSTFAVLFKIFYYENIYFKFKTSKSANSMF